MKKHIVHTILGLAVVLFAAAAAGVELEKFKGRIVGQQCAEKGKIGECYLKWADPMVFWTEEGDTYAIDLARSGIKQEKLDEAFGQEVEVFGNIAKVGKNDQVVIAQLNVLKPPGTREFFKG